MPKTVETHAGFDRPVSADDVVRLAGDLDAETVISIVETGATYAEFEEAVMWARGEAEQLGKEGYTLTGAAATVYDILVSDPSFVGEAER